MANLNIAALDNALSELTISKSKPPLWRVIQDRLTEVENAKKAGMTYAEIAKEVGVTKSSFSTALKKARTFENEKKEGLALDQKTLARSKKPSFNNTIKSTVKEIEVDNDDALMREY